MPQCGETETIMISNIELFGTSIPLYGIFFYLGIALAAIAALIISKKISFPCWEIVYSAIYVMIGAMLGAKLLFIAVSWDQIVEYNLSFIQIIKGGFVFYGGLIGGAIGLFIYTSVYKANIIEYIDIYATVLPLGHAIGRIGCFFAGCCYGVPSSFGVIYTQTVGQTPLGIKLFPVQLAESACLIALFIILLVLFFKSKRKGIVALVYAFSYSVIRFVLEFFRGDAERGIFFGISTSQWICILLALISTILLFLRIQKLKRAD